MVLVSLKTEKRVDHPKNFRNERVRGLEPLRGISLDSRAVKRKTSKYEKNLNEVDFTFDFRFKVLPPINILFFFPRTPFHRLPIERMN